MAKARKRYFDISPGWAGAQEVGLGTEGFLAPLWTTICFAGLEALYDEPMPSSAKFGFHKRPNAMPDMVYATGNVPIVNAAFKSVIEAMAPGEAEFRPFAMRWPDDEPVAGDWYLMNVLNLVDCFDLEHMRKAQPELTHVHPFTKEPYSPLEVWLLARMDQNGMPEPSYIDPATVGALHIWRPYYQTMRLFATGELVKALKAAGVKRLHVERLGTRDDPVPVRDWAAMGVRLPGSGWTPRTTG